MLRPAVLLLVSRLFNAPPCLAVRLAAAVELVHAASLIHDDGIDDARTRRGRPTLGSRIGTPEAVLFGDSVFAGAFAEVIATGRLDMARELARTGVEVCAGEVRQNISKGNFALSRPRYLEIVRLKTGSLYRACGALGAMAGDAVPSHVRAAAQFGLAFGMAFQAADDLLDVIGDPDVTGKPRGSDVSQGKATLPVIVYLEKLSPARRSRVRRTLSAGAADDNAAVLVKLAKPPVVAAVRSVADEYRLKALAALDRLPDGPEKKDLAALCRFAVRRTY
jgi:octaprenyl-diphosphate synthase